MNRIHPTAVIDPSAEIHESVVVGPHCVLEGPIVLGRGCKLHAHVTLMGDTKIGEENVFFPGAVIGAPPQDLKYSGEQTRLVIANGNHFREYVTVHPGTDGGGGTTRIGNENLFMIGSHVAHDCDIANGVVLSNHVLLAGHIKVADHAILNGASACHHFTTVGRLSYVGGLTRITQDVHPFTIVEGHPARIRACNSIGMQRAGLDPADIEIVRNAIFSIFVSDKRPAAEGMAECEAKHGEHPLIRELLDSVYASEAGRQGRAAEPVRGPRREEVQG